MKRLYAALTGVGVLALVVSLGGPWWIVSLEGGAQIPVSGLTASPLASSLLAVAGAAFGLGLLLRGVGRRIVSLVQVLAVGSTGYVLASLATAPETAAVSEIASLTGIAGSGALDFVASTEPTAMLWIGVVGLLGAMGSGLVGVWMRDRPVRTSRYQRSGSSPDPQDSIAAWDHLSEGSDPTTR
jgi:uncharacterized membrane protein (TIGR02234 family)